MDSQFTLLNGGPPPKDPAAAGSGAGRPALYDFRKPDRLPTSQIRQLYGLPRDYVVNGQQVFKGEVVTIGSKVASRSALRPSK